MSKFEIDQRIQVNIPTEPRYHEKGGTILGAVKRSLYYEYQVILDGTTYLTDFVEWELIPEPQQGTRQAEKFKAGDLVCIRRTGDIASVVRYAPLDGDLLIVIVETARWGDKYQFPVYEKDLEESK